MKIALVGWTFSEMDFSVLLNTYKLLDLPKAGHDLDFIDLRADRDFLKENKKYDIVVPIYIFNFHEEDLDSEYLDRSNAVSKLHSKENWRKRLLDTEAKDILFFGMYPRSELSAEYIGELENYVMKHIELRIESGSRVGFHYGNIWHYKRLL